MITSIRWPRQVGVAYRRPDGSGHVVVLNSPGSPYRRYMDYQSRARGQDVTSEVRASRIYIIFALDRQRTTSEAYARERQSREEQEARRVRELQQQEEERTQREQNGFYGGRFHD
ncbi:uncharacterized protein LAESUDRAFT_789266 [Laetiporus sulphureus 93-53]|uniref:Uncharacterized protein n=1 Tax=Laetiporus sulphureus 93-53 TaxID=1314785 RepID=A0A165GXU1_9APHY|nr:uncharacterized protein LAESUDRAFT_789266 [Laetiporus sulphureus 93-53]KZT10975.1 hypothetical protein LAESUDRAFT_789266 [Laetiporus sulphureus 93-53]